MSLKSFDSRTVLVNMGLEEGEIHNILEGSRNMVLEKIEELKSITSHELVGVLDLAFDIHLLDELTKFIYTVLNFKYNFISVDINKICGIIIDYHSNNLENTSEVYISNLSSDLLSDTHINQLLGDCYDLLLKLWEINKNFMNVDIEVEQRSTIDLLKYKIASFIKINGIEIDNEYDKIYNILNILIGKFNRDKIAQDIKYIKETSDNVIRIEDIRFRNALRLLAEQALYTEARMKSALSVSSANFDKLNKKLRGLASNIRGIGDKTVAIAKRIEEDASMVKDIAATAQNIDKSLHLVSQPVSKLIDTLDNNLPL